ncbi:MAG: hypothetical protein M9962_12925 [Oligoflexia bacterium]|nr:hypothetical protein [Oligoflexia bacterium]
MPSLRNFARFLPPFLPFLGVFTPLFFSNNVSFALDSNELLPQSVNSPAIRFGVVSGVDSKYNADGAVQSLNEINTIHFNAEQLQKLDSGISDLANILNQFSQQELGSQLNLGSLRVETIPDVKYLVPIYARGITDNLTLAIAAPIVFYKNKLTLNQSASNAEQICNYFRSTQKDIPELKDACDKLKVKIKDSVQNELKNLGYKPIEDRSETIFGDIQLVGLYKFYNVNPISLVSRTTLNLPTGQTNDPDDLADLGAFGTRSIEEFVILNWTPNRKFRIASKVGYRFMIPDRAEVRVPGSAGDILPGPSSKENVKRDLGDSLTVGGAINYAIWGALTIAGGYEFVMKGADKYSGSRGKKYDLLGQDTQSRAHKLKAGISYDTIELYQRTKSFPPLKLDFDVTNTFAGVNSDRQLVNELSLTMFF